MVNRNKGYAMVIVLVVIVVLFLLSGALSILINGQISLSSANFNRINAKYNAEVGIEEGISKIKYTNITSTSDFTSSNWNQGSYSYKIYPPGASGVAGNYKIESTGVYKDNSKNITAFISDGDPEKTFIYGNQFKLNDTNIEDINPDDYFDTFSGSQKLDPNDITDLYLEALVYFYDADKDGDIDEVDSNNDGIPNAGAAPAITLDTLQTGDTEIVVNQQFTYERNTLHHYRGNLTFNGGNQGNTAIEDEVINDDQVNPPIIVVDGDLTFSSIRNVNGVIFIVGGNINLDLRSAQLTLNNTFLYSQNDITLAKDVGNPNLNPLINLNGQIIVENNIDIKIKNNNDAVYSGMNWPSDFDYSGDNSLYNIKYQVVKWIE